MNGRKDQHDSRRGRVDPTLGDLGLLAEPAPASEPEDVLPRIDLEPGTRRMPRRPPRPQRRWPVWVGMAALVALALVLWANQDHLRGLVPRTELNDVLARAELALQAGRLEGGDGQSAHELFAKARALEPDNERARDGLHQVGMAELSRADAAFRDGDLARAQSVLSDAREVLGGGRDVDHLEQQIAHARAASMSPGGTIDQAQQALAAGELEGDAGAAALYQKVLRADPNNAVAAHGLDKVGAALAARAHAALDAGNDAAASDLVDQLAALLPNYGELPELRAIQEQHRQQQAQAVDDALARGEQALRAGRIGGSGDDSALAAFRKALTLDPHNARAQAGLGQVAQALVVQANAALDSDDRYQARVLLDRAAELAPSSSDLAAARARLEAEPATPTLAPLALTPQQTEQVLDLVRRARDAAQAGRIMLPPGESAYDLYRSALAIDGNNAAARAGLQDLPQLVSRQLEQAIEDGQLTRADSLLRELGDLAPADAVGLGLRQRLASAWLEQAGQQLDRGDRGGALQSLQRARRLDPQQPGMQQLAARLQGNR